MRVISGGRSLNDGGQILASDNDGAAGINDGNSIYSVPAMLSIRSLVLFAALWALCGCEKSRADSGGFHERMGTSKVEIDAAITKAANFLAEMSEIPKSKNFPTDYVVDWQSRYEHDGRLIITVLFGHKDDYKFNITDGKYVKACMDGCPIFVFAILERIESDPVEFRIVGQSTP